MAKNTFECEANDLPTLDAGFWKEGEAITGTVQGFRAVKLGEGQSGKMIQLALSGPVQIAGEQFEEVELPANSTGFRMAIEKLQREHGFDNLHVKDLITLTCIGIRKAKKEGYSDSPRFRIRVVRP